MGGRWGCVGWPGVENKASLNLIKITELSGRRVSMGARGLAGGGRGFIQVSIKLQKFQLSGQSGRGMGAREVAGGERPSGQSGRRVWMGARGVAGASHSISSALAGRRGLGRWGGKAFLKSMGWRGVGNKASLNGAAGGGKGLIESHSNYRTVSSRSSQAAGFG